jgi:uncharacterized coiled-coil DUF342 family protein
MTPSSYTLQRLFFPVPPADERPVLLNDFAQKRERLHAQASRHREIRDKLNDETKRHSARRDDFNAQVRALVEKANGHKAKRDALNRQVHEAKAKRDELNREAHAKTEALNALRRDRGPAPGVSVPKLRAEIKHLEYQQQTTVLSPKKEKELIDLIAAKLKELKEREGAMEENAETKRAWEEMKAAKAAAEAQHQAVTQLANEAQGEHDQMAQLFAQADGLRKQADAAQADFVKSKVAADAEHRGFVDAISAARDLERVMGALRSREPGRERVAVAADSSAGAQEQAEELFDKFRKGEKLSTEDLLALQKAGRL